MAKAIETFRKTNNYNDCLSIIGAKNDPLLVLQYAMSITSSQIERDAFEDIAFYICNEADCKTITKEYIKEITSGLSNAYGYSAVKLLKDDLSFLLSGIFSYLPDISTNAIIAILGKYLEDIVEEKFLVDKSKAGDKLQYVNTKCRLCNGTGYIFCKKCFSINIESFEKINSSIFDLLFKSLKGKGCESCNFQPIKDCECAFEIKIPSRLEDFHIVEGYYKASKTKFYCAIIKSKENKVE